MNTNNSKRRPTAALIVAIVALVAAMSGAAVALPGKNTVKSNDIAKDAVKSSDIAKEAVSSAEITDDKVKSKDLQDDGIKGKDVGEGALDSSHLSDYELLGDSPVKVTATERVTLAAARAAAPETPLYSADSIDVYAKCLVATGPGVISGEIYARSSADGAMMEGTDDLPGSEGTEFLNASTAEVDRQLDTEESSTANTASYNESEGLITSAEGRSFNLLFNIGVKHGTPAGGNGPFGAGNVCLFGGAVFG
jgi:hypothetical protein